jgi:electron-transferring-flavoprotein dehydrogenase
MNQTDVEAPERESMAFDVVIVGAGPAGLAAAIRLKQSDPDCSVVVVEKGSEVGAHILSGAVMDPAPLHDLLPGWREDETCPIRTEVSEDSFSYLTETSSYSLPTRLMPPLMNNEGCYVVSLGNVCRWLGEQAENLGVEIYPGFAASDVVINEAGAVTGIVTGDLGIGKDGEKTPNYMPGMILEGRYVLIAEGVRGSLAQKLIKHYALNKDCEPQKYGLGIKELWQIDPAKHRPGKVSHSFGWPLDNKTGGGSFIYHLQDDHQIYIGYVVHLNYENPHLSPFEEFQRFKTHPSIAPLLEGGKRLSYGARAISEGGYQSVPGLTVPGGALLGCSAGFVNVPRIKGIHNALRSGMQAADAVTVALKEGRAHDELTAYDKGWQDSPIGRDLYPVRNVKPLWSRHGTRLGAMLGGLDMWMNRLGFSLFSTLPHGKADHECLKPADQCQPISYPKPDGVLTFDRLSSVYLSNTNHEENQPSHLKVQDMELQKNSAWGVYGGPSAHYCPAAVYEWVPDKDGISFVINAQNCVHCKTCDIKDPNQNIVWAVPEGSGGPNYPNM